jgi:hypothetical protein
MTDGVYSQVFSDRAGMQTADEICLQAISNAFDIMQSKAEKAGQDLADIDDSLYNRLITAFIYFAKSEGYGVNHNWGSYNNERRQGLKMLSDIWGSATSDDATDAPSTTFIATEVTAQTYTAKESKLYSNSLW